MKDYHDLYFKWGVLLLADVFEKFWIAYRIMDYVQVNIWAQVGMLCLKWQKLSLKLFKILACIYSLRKVLPLLSRRGGISYISNRYSEASNKYLKSYDPNQESKHSIYLEANNLYGYPCLNFFQQVDSNGWIQKSLTWINILEIVQKDVFLKLILNIENNYKNYIMIIL